MSNSVERSTYIESDAKTTKALTYDMLNGVYNKLEELTDNQSLQFSKCDARMKIIEKRKQKNTALAVSSGFVGGFTATVAYYIKNLFSQ
jgi:pantothenate kinase type III